MCSELKKKEDKMPQNHTKQKHKKVVRKQWKTETNSISNGLLTRVSHRLEH